MIIIDKNRASGGARPALVTLTPLPRSPRRYDAAIDVTRAAAPIMTSQPMIGRNGAMGTNSSTTNKSKQVQLFV